VGIASVTVLQLTNAHLDQQEPKDHQEAGHQMEFQVRMANLVKMLNLPHHHQPLRQVVSNAHLVTQVHLETLVTQARRV